ncbi:hypothetical protein HO173_005764 [Letharia columbiana]|uniref:Glycoside hydrolase family 71 protein n=1 Tax=Letharia columbiana TaxID=112416 RepID=A0A8H6L5D8_9LECA|nr:uncharacterized protein HO173_005764 [Letharia columbiana]KAF6236135.1 hypothetical protein HO173_005764 [Letharia columbiana]
MYPSALAAVYAVLLTTLATSISCLHHTHTHAHTHLSKRATTPMVFAHYMIQFAPPGLNGNSSPDYSTDINMAKAAGFDAFAIDYTDNAALFATNLDILYHTASTLGFKLFLTIDTTTMYDVAQVVNITSFYANSPAQLKDAAGNIFLSSFEVNPPGWNWQTNVIDQLNIQNIGVNFLPGSLGQDGAYEASLPDRGTGLFTWIHPALSASEEAAVDQTFADARDSSGKPWMAGVAPWFFKRLASETNWLNAQDSNIYIDRWVELLKLKPDYIEVISWNDFGESHYIGPADTTPEAELMLPSKADYYGNLDHSAFLKMSTFFINTYKAGETNVTVTADEEDVFFFYRPQPVNNIPTNDTYLDNAWPLPENASSIADNVYVVPFLSEPATIYLSSGGYSTSMDAPSFLSKSAITFNSPAKMGQQILTASRPINGQTLNKTGTVDITSGGSRYQGNVVAI